MTSLTTTQQDALRAVQEAYPEARMALIGAAALALHIPMEWRTTADIDLVVAISVADLTTELSRLPGWKRDAKRHQRWAAPNGVLVDLVPASPEALEKRELVWPNGHAMNLAGIRLALTAAPMAIAEGLSVPVPSIPVIALLKIAAYLDRPSEREKDLKDLTHIWDSYPPTADERFFSDDIVSREFDEPRARTFILGAELRAIVDEHDAEIVERFLKKTAEGAHGRARLLANSPWRFSEENLRSRIDAFREGFQPASKPGIDPSFARVPRSHIPITFVVNGEEVVVDAALREPLSAAVKEALRESKNTGRQPEEWELRYETGTAIPDQSRPVGEYGFAPGTVLYLTLKVGAGGHATRPRS